ncbi:MAG TPA: hypothetical protein VLA82_02215, partial [Actinomycetota bacterium]|nr:hypothetical protein [Actinomycetota bacterium]
EIGRPDLASGALDGATSAAVDLGLYGDTRGPVERRLALADAVDDPWERGDIYAMATWTYVMLGEARTALRWAQEGANLVEEQGAEGVSLHSFAWGAFAQFELGAWDAALEWTVRCRARLGDRVETPPYFTAHAFCSAAMIHRLRDESAELEALRPTLRSLLGEGPVHHFQGAARAWMAWLAIRERRFDEAERLVEETRSTATDTPRPFIARVQAELLAAAGRWADVPAFLDEARAYAHDAGLRALPLHLDRLEARACAAAGDAERASRSFASAADGFAELEHRWEAARCDLELAETTVADDPEAARRTAGRAIVVFRELRSVDELRRAERLVGASA